MGEEVAGHRQLLSSPKIGSASLADDAARLADRHGLARSAELELLIDHLFGLACRDQEERYIEPSKMAECRREGFKLAKEMRQEADAMLVSLERLHRAYCNFQEVVRFSPSLLNSIFDVDTGEPEQLFLPPGLEILQSGFYGVQSGEQPRKFEPASDSDVSKILDPNAPCPPFLWESIGAKLQEFADLPIKERLARGPVRNAVLCAAVTRCRAYWVEVENRSWTMSSLKVAAVRRESDVETLKGRCEKFVADALSDAGIRFSLSDLSSAWDAVDRAERDTSATSRARAKDQSSI